MRHSFRHRFRRKNNTLNKNTSFTDKTLSSPDHMSPQVESMQKKYEEAEEQIAHLKNIIFHQERLCFLVGRFAAGIAHEVRNPLTIIKGFMQLLHKDLERIDKKDYAEMVISEVNRANHIIEDFLTAAKFNESSKKKVYLKQFFAEIDALIQSEALLRNIQISINLEQVDSNCATQMDSQEIKQVFLNLLKNSVEAIEDSPNKNEGYICIKVIQKNEYIKISIKDNGKGMDDVVLSNLYTPFFTTKEEGTGLGMALCREIIHNHNGKIEVESEVGVGTRFDIYLNRSE
ncbi:TPA: GHKL domain-containing protein [Bacillus wiedmannii]|nr:GHKL domain-containing protein [Bacillus wiedmannii]